MPSQPSAARELVAELMEEPDVLESVLPRLSRGPQQMAPVFGEELAELAGNDPDWLERLSAAVEEAPADERNFGMLAGYLGWLAKARPDHAEAFKLRAAESTALAPSLPQLCIASGVTPSDIVLMVAAFQAGSLPPLRLTALGFGLDGLSTQDVAPLFDALLCEDAWEVALDLMSSYTLTGQERIGGLRPQMVRLAEGVARWPATLSPDPPMKPVLRESPSCAAARTAPCRRPLVSRESPATPS